MLPRCCPPSSSLMLSADAHAVYATMHCVVYCVSQFCSNVVRSNYYAHRQREQPVQRADHGGFDVQAHIVAIKQRVHLREFEHWLQGIALVADDKLCKVPHLRKSDDPFVAKREEERKKKRQHRTTQIILCISFVSGKQAVGWGRKMYLHCEGNQV